MIIKIDFSLSPRRYQTVEQTIFRLVLGGLVETQTIATLLCIYSDDVIANAVKKLVNYQILAANLEMRTLSLSAPLLALTEACLEHTHTVDIPDIILQNAEEGKIYVTDDTVKQQILEVLLPDVRVGFLVRSLDFVLYSQGGAE